MNDTRQSVLFVDDEPELLGGLQNALRRYRDEWDAHFASSGAEALEKVADAPFAAIVTDMRMPGMDGAALLDALCDLRIDAVRMVMTGQTDPATTVRIVGTAHRMLSKPCSLDDLQQTLRMVTTLRALIRDDASRLAVAHARYFRMSPTVVNALDTLLSSPAATPADVAALVRQDPGLAVKVLQLVHAGFLGKERAITSIETAVAQIGVDVLRILPAPPPSVATNHSGLRAAGMSNDRLARHATYVAQLAQRIAPESVDPTTAYTAGLLSVAGIGTIAAELPHETVAVLKHAVTHQVPIHVAERTIYEYDHAMIGAYVLGLWGLPDAIVEAVRYHHSPQDAGPTLGLAGVVHIADAIITGAYPLTKQHAPPLETSLDVVYLSECGVASRLREWKAEATLLVSADL